MFCDFGTYPCEDRKEGEDNSCLHVVDSIVAFRCISIPPFIGQVAKTNKIQEGPETYCIIKW
jgi:hypothetical protein